MNKEYDIITLGPDCRSRGYLTGWMLIPTKNSGRLSFPFDLAVHHTDVVVKHLHEDFENYFTNIKYGYKSVNRYYWTNDNDRTIYYHDLDCGDNYNKFHKRYNNRIKNFQKTLKNDDKFLFFVTFFTSQTGKPEDINNLYNELKLYRNDKPFKLLVYDIEDVLKNHNINPDVKILVSLIPDENPMGNWDKTKDASDEMRKYLNKLKELTIQSIKEEGFDVIYYQKNYKDKFQSWIKYKLPQIFSITNNWVDHYKVMILFGHKFNLFKIKD